MFALHETTRRGLCRMGFVLLCVLPLCAVLAGAYWVRSDTHKAWHERSLSRHLGLDVTLERVVLMSPREVRYEGVSITDPETSTPLAQAGALAVGHYDRLWQIRVSAPQLYVAGLEGFQELVVRELKRGRPGERIQFISEDVLLHQQGKKPLTLDQVRGQFTFTKPAAEAAVEFRPVGQTEGGVVTARLVRNRQTLPPGMGFEINAGETAVPCALLAPFFPAIERLGSESRFRGILWANATPQGWSGKLLESEFTDVNLATLVEEHFPRQLSGTAHLTVGGAEFTAGRIDQLHGELVCHGGTIHRDLALRLTSQLGLTARGIDQTFGASHPLSELAFSFALDRSGLLITGRCDSAAPGTVMVDHVGESIRQPQPPVRLPLVVLEQVFSRTRGQLISVLPGREDGRVQR